ncbi:MAG: hypothetical protein ACKOET_10450 [Verrucomicrobiota bacterium]
MISIGSDCATTSPWITARAWTTWAPTVAFAQAALWGTANPTAVGGISCDLSEVATT